jgi:hypothetical protein
VDCRVRRDQIDRCGLAPCAGLAPVRSSSSSPLTGRAGANLGGAE